MTKVLAICVNYHDEENTDRFVKKFLEQHGSEFLEIIIADTSGRTTPHPALILLQENDNRVSVFTIGQNIGYFGAAHWALLRYLEKNELPEWIIVSNTDIFIEGAKFLQKLFLIQFEHEPAIVAPSIISTQTYLDQNPHMLLRPTRLKLLIHRLFLMNYYTYYWFLTLYSLRQYIKSKVNKKSISGGKLLKVSKNIYAPHGSFIILPNEYFTRGGTLNYELFLFGEEYFIAETAKLLDLKIIYEPNLTVFHDEHKTVGNSLNKAKWRYFSQANLFCLERYFCRR